MKKFCKVLKISGLAFCAALIAAACSVPFEQVKKTAGGEPLAAGTGRVVVSVAASGARTVFPDMDDAGGELAYIVKAKTDNGELDPEKTEKEDRLDFGLVQGTLNFDLAASSAELGAVEWVITIEAWATDGGGEPQTLIAQAEVGPFELEDGETQYFRNVALKPVGSGQGTFYWSVEFPEGVSKAVLSYNDGAADQEINLLDEDDCDIDNTAPGILTASGSVDLDAGFYEFTLELRSADGSRRAGDLEIVYIYSGLDTFKSGENGWVFGEEHLKTHADVTVTLPLSKHTDTVIESVTLTTLSRAPVGEESVEGTIYTFILKDVPLAHDTLDLALTITTENNTLVKTYSGVAMNMDNEAALDQVIVQQLELTTTGGGAGTLSAAVAGQTVAPALDLIDVFAGDSVTVTAAPNSDKNFFGGFDVIGVAEADYTESHDTTGGTLAFTMPNDKVIIDGEFSGTPEFLVTVVNGSGGGTYEAGDTVNIAVPEAYNSMFDVWTVSVSSGNALAFTTGNVNAPSAAFTMPAENVNVTATFINLPTVKFGDVDVPVMFEQKGGAEITAILNSNSTNQNGYTYRVSSTADGGEGYNSSNRVQFSVDLADIKAGYSAKLESYTKVSYYVEANGETYKRTTLLAGKPFAEGYLGDAPHNDAANQYLMTAPIGGENYATNRQRMEFDLLPAKTAAVDAQSAGTIVDLCTYVNLPVGNTYTYTITEIVFTRDVDFGLPIIAGVPGSVKAGEPFDLPTDYDANGAVAEGQTIVWAVKDEGGTGAEINGNTLTAADEGTITITATIDGVTREYEVKVNPAGGGGPFVVDFTAVEWTRPLPQWNESQFEYQNGRYQVTATTSNSYTVIGTNSWGGTGILAFKVTLPQSLDNYSTITFTISSASGFNWRLLVDTFAHNFDGQYQNDFPTYQLDGANGTGNKVVTIDAGSLVITRLGDTLEVLFAIRWETDNQDFTISDFTLNP